MSTTAEIARTWALLGVRERLGLAWRTLFAGSLTGGVVALASWGLEALGHTGDWYEVALVIGAVVLGGFLGSYLYLVRAGSPNWRKRV